MKIRTSEQLISAIATEAAWRKRELSELKLLIAGASQNQTRQAVLIRAGVALLYAHWEGFVKAAAQLYLEFVAMQRCRNAELADNVLAITLRSKLLVAQGAKKIGAHRSIVEFFRQHMEKRSTLPKKDIINTESNLSSAVLSEILSTLGLPRADYEAKFHLIDNQLVAKRNHIAHGNDLTVDAAGYLELHYEISKLMTLFRNQLENAAVTRDYLLNPSNAGPR